MKPQTTSEIPTLEGLLRDRVSAEVAIRDAADKQRQQQKFVKESESLTRKLRKVLGIEYSGAFDSSTGHPVVEIEGFAFTVQHHEFEDQLALMRQCPHCHEVVLRRVSRYTDLDEQKSLGYLHEDGKCVQVQSSTTTAEVLLTALESFIRSCNG